MQATHRAVPSNLERSIQAILAPSRPSAQRGYFVALGSTITSNSFFVPSSPGTAASVFGFGVVFTDVDIPGSTSLTFFDVNGSPLGVFNAPVSNNGFSFIGVSFNAGELIGSVCVNSGSDPLGANVNDGGPFDVVAMEWRGRRTTPLMKMRTNLATQSSLPGSYQQPGTTPKSPPPACTECPRHDIRSARESYQTLPTVPFGNGVLPRHANGRAPLLSEPGYSKANTLRTPPFRKACPANEPCGALPKVHTIASDSFQRPTVVGTDLEPVPAAAGNGQIRHKVTVSRGS
jgi:hypothetical protein